MNLIRLAIDRPTAVIAVVLMVVMFGFLSLQAIPIQLTPDVRKPVISLSTVWPGAAPAEIEREITNRQEEVFKGLEGLESITSQSLDGRSRITLEFAVGQNMERALLLVANRLDRVNGYPSEAGEPSISTSGSDDSPIAWMMLKRLPGNTSDIHTFGDFIEDTIKDRLERVSGVSLVNVFGGASTEMQIIVDPSRMAQYGLTVSQMVTSLRQANASVTAGDVDEGKRRYVVRTDGDLSSIEDVKQVVLRSDWDPGTGSLSRVTVADIADVRFDTKDPVARIRYNTVQAIAINTVRETGANVIEVMKGIKEAVAELNESVLPNAGLELEQVYDETDYINSSINLVQQNIVIGGVLAAMMLLLFLRSGSATLIVSMAIPVSVIGAFVAMAALGRSINVISLAGLAFAVGMVVDAAIVVLENIYRYREQGMSRAEAAYKGAAQVWSAVLVSALTTVMVFIPILVMELEVGQLFRDIAVALSVSVLLSLLVAITVIPALSKHLLKDAVSPQKSRFRIPIVDDFASYFVRLVLRYTRMVTHSKTISVALIIGVCGIASAFTIIFLPKLEYLPDGNRNLIFGILIPPPGYNLDTTSIIANKFEDSVLPFLSRENQPPEKESDTPRIKRFFFVVLRGQSFIGASAEDPKRIGKLIPVMQRASFVEPGTFGMITQQSLFGRGLEGSRSIELNVTGPELETILSTALRTVGNIGVILPRSEGTQIRPRPGLELGAPEIRIYPDRIKLADNGVTARELGDTLDAFNDGLRVAEITVGSKRLDLVLKGLQGSINETQGIQNLPVVTSSGKILSASSLARIEVTSGPTQIRHIERERTVTIQIRPPANIALETALEMLQVDVIDKMEAEGLPEGIRLRLSGTADKLVQTWDAMVIQLLVAVAIVYLVMAILFESFIYPLVIMLSVPLAAAGGVMGLLLLNTVTLQPLDMLTLLGFVILIGIVVNNAILLVHQTLAHIRIDQLEVAEAIIEATRNRVRPIFMSTLTSIFGMLPLVLFPGEGSELYRGLGSVILGGLSLSAILTLVIIPPLLSLIANSLPHPSLKKA